eukprot:5872845-Amphidinium_carterae.1
MNVLHAHRGAGASPIQDTHSTQFASQHGGIQARRFRNHQKSPNHKFNHSMQLGTLDTSRLHVHHTVNHTIH